jgi:hypothetical protein
MRIVDPSGLVLFGLGFALLCMSLVVMLGGLAILFGWDKP